MEALAVFVGALLAFAGVIVTAHVAIRENSRNAVRLQKQPFLERQLELCMEASNVAAILATTRSRKAFDQAHSRFLELYWGPLSVVENRDVSQAMIDFLGALDGLAGKGGPLPRSDLEHLSYELAKKVRELILGAWEIRKLKPSVGTDKESVAEACSAAPPQQPASPP